MTLQQLNGSVARTPTTFWLGPVAVGVASALAALLVVRPLVAAAGMGLVAVLIVYAMLQRHPDVVFLGAWIFIVFQLPAAAAAGYDSQLGVVVRQADDYFVLLLGALTVARACSGAGIRAYKPWILPFVLFLLAGVIGGMLNDMPPLQLAQGAYLNGKVLIVAWIVSTYAWGDREWTRIYRVVVAVSAFAAVWGVVDAVSAGSLSSVISSNTAVGAFRSASVQSFFTTPGRYAFAMVVAFALVMAKYVVARDTKSLLYALFFAASSLLSLRVKGAVALVVVVLVLVTMQRANAALADRRRPVAAILAVGMLVLVAAPTVVVGQLQRYTSERTSAREALYVGSVRIASEHPAFGTGFGSYGDFIARSIYSRHYDQLGFSDVHGLTRADRSALTDTSWPAILANSGLIGLTGYGLSCWFLVGHLRRKVALAASDSELVAAFAGLAVLAGLLVDSLANPTLFDAYAAVSLALCLGHRSRRESSTT